MRFLGAAATLVAWTSFGHAAPLASLTQDLDNDGTPETIEVSAAGLLTIAQGGPRAKLELGSVTAVKLAVARRDGRTLLVVDQQRSRTDREAMILEYRRTGATGVAAIVASTKLGGVGLDAEYQYELAATAAGLYRYQTRQDIRRCDGKPTYLFAEGLDGSTFKRVSRPPDQVPAALPTLTVKIDGAPAVAPLLVHAKAASLQPGVADAGGLGIPHELDDGKLDTVWREELAKSSGEGQFFTFEPRLDGVQARQLRIVPGNPISAATMKAANRPRMLALVTPSNAWRIELPDAASDPLRTAYVVDLPKGIECLTVVLESTYGSSPGATAIAELEVFAEGERAGGAEAMLARIVAEGKEGSIGAASVLARRGASAATAIDAELAKTTDAAGRRRLIAVLVKIQDPAAAPSLTRAATEGWVTGPALLDLIGALARNGLVQEIHDVAGNSGIALDARIAAVGHLGTSSKELALLVDLAGTGPVELRRAVIDRLSLAPAEVLIQAATTNTDPPASGDLWRALTRHARIETSARAGALAALLAALPAATDYERRYRIVDGVATLGDAAALRGLEAMLRGMPAGAQTSALRQVAIRAIGYVPRPDAVKLILAFSQDPDPGVRIAVLSALAGAETDAGDPWHTADSPDGIDRVITNALATDRWPEIRRRAASTLGARCQRPGPARALGDAVARDKHIEVRVDSLTALVQCRASGIEQLLAKTWDDSKSPIELRTQAVNLAVVLGDPKLGALLVGKFTRWRGAAIESAEALALAQSAAASIGRLQAPGAAQALSAALDDSAFPEIVSAAALALGALGPACPASAKAKLNVLARSEDQSAVAAKRAAAQCGR